MIDDGFQIICVAMTTLHENVRLTGINKDINHLSAVMSIAVNPLLH